MNWFVTNEEYMEDESNDYMEVELLYGLVKNK
jgi:hypothetical protein